MKTRRKTIAWALSTTALSMAVGTATASEPAQRGQLKQQAETRIARLEERLANVAPGGRDAELAAAMARRQAELARKLLDHGNPVAARVIADGAERFLKIAEDKEEQE